METSTKTTKTNSLRPQEDLEGWTGPYKTVGHPERETCDHRETQKRCNRQPTSYKPSPWEATVTCYGRSGRGWHLTKVGRATPLSRTSRSEKRRPQVLRSPTSRRSLLPGVGRDAGGPGLETSVPPVTTHGDTRQTPRPDTRYPGSRYTPVNRVPLYFCRGPEGPVSVPSRTKGYVRNTCQKPSSCTNKLCICGIFPKTGTYG